MEPSDEELLLRSVQDPETFADFYRRHAEAILRYHESTFRGPWLEATAADLARIHVPTLLVAGERSPPAFRRVTERLAAAIPHSRMVLVGGGHFIDPGEPDVLEFVGEVLGC